MHDVLSDVLDTLELESSIYFRAELSSPFSIAVPENRNVIRFHIVSTGRCLVSAEGEAPIEFEPGDLVMIPHGLAHVLSDSAAPSSESLPEVLASAGFDGVGPLVYGGGGESTTLVCGHFGFGVAQTHPFLETLPKILHLKRIDGPGYAWVEQMLAFADKEAHSRATGWHAVVERVSQILLVHVLREHMNREAEVAGALSALADPQLASALEALHASPSTDWTLESLAEKASMSRSVFARKFGAACGMPPMRYLTHWRMSRARFLLAHTETSAGEVAARVGYASEAAFNRTFREHFGSPPATYRRRSRARTEAATSSSSRSSPGISRARPRESKPSAE